MIGPVNSGVTGLAITVFRPGQIVVGRHVGVALQTQHHHAGALQLPWIGASVWHMTTDAASAIGRRVGEDQRETLFGVAVDAGPTV